MKVFHLLNPSARSKPGVEESLRGAGGPAQNYAWISREHPQHAETMIDWALQEGVGRLVVWGGDGTFHRVVRGLLNRRALGEMELALVPSGTCNDLARRLGVSQAQWAQWESERPRGRLAELTIARLRWSQAPESWDIFINNAGFGRPIASFQRKDPAWRVLWSFAPLHIKARWPEGNLSGVYYLGLFCSSPYFSGGLYFEKSADPESGSLHFYFVPATGKARLAMRLAAGRCGFPLKDDKVTYVRTNRMEIESSDPLWPQVDGEAPPEEGTRSLAVDILPEKAAVWRPAPAA